MTLAAMTALAAAVFAAKSDALSAIGSALRLGLTIAPFKNVDGTVDDSKATVRIANNRGEEGVKNLTNWRRGCHLEPLNGLEPTVGKTYTMFFLDLSILSAAKMHSGMMDWYAIATDTTVAALLNPAEVSKLDKMKQAWNGKFAVSGSAACTPETLNEMYDAAQAYLGSAECNLPDDARGIVRRIMNDLHFYAEKGIK